MNKTTVEELARLAEVLETYELTTYAEQVDDLLEKAAEIYSEAAEMYQVVSVVPGRLGSTRLTNPKTGEMVDVPTDILVQQIGKTPRAGDSVPYSAQQITTVQPMGTPPAQQAAQTQKGISPVEAVQLFQANPGYRKSMEKRIRTDSYWGPKWRGLSLSDQDMVSILQHIGILGK